MIAQGDLRERVADLDPREPAVVAVARPDRPHVALRAVRESLDECVGMIT